MLAPTKEMLDGYKKRGGSWDDYERKFLDLMADRRIEEKLDPELLEDACLLCSEDQPHYCHRRLVAEYLKEHWGDVEIAHLRVGVGGFPASAWPPFRGQLQTAMTTA